MMVGWFFSLIFIGIGAFAATYSGLLIYECCVHISASTGKRVMSFPDLGAHCFGEDKRNYFNGICYSYIALTLIIQQVTLTSSFQAVVWLSHPLLTAIQCGV